MTEIATAPVEPEAGTTAPATEHPRDEFGRFVSPQPAETTSPSADPAAEPAATAEGGDTPRQEETD